MPTNRVIRTVSLSLAGAAAMAALGVFVVRDQESRHRRNLFSPRPLRRLAALGYIGRHPYVENAHLLRDFLSWERVPRLRRRAEAILEKIELYLAAHFVALTSEKGTLKFSKVGDSSDAWDVTELGEGLRATRYGQTALVLDTSGILANKGSSKLKALFRIV